MKISINPRKPSLLFPWALFFVTLFPSLAVQAQITVFPECNFLGPAVNLPEGDYTASKLLERGVRDNSIASVIVSEGYAAQLYTDDRFSGRSGKALELVRCLENTQYHRNISSLSVFRVDQNGNPLAGNAAENAGTDAFSGEAVASVIELHSDCHYRGQAITLGAGKYTAAKLAEAGLPDNSISSIRVPQGMKILLYENDFFRGRSASLGADSDCLVERFDDQVSSVIISGSARAPAQAPLATPELPPVVVYDSCDYRGRSASLPVGDYMASELSALGLADNSIASIRVPAGLEALVYEHDFMRGRSSRVASSTRCLTGSEFERIISSLSIARATADTQKPLASGQAPAGRVTIFTECHYQGRFAELPAGEYSARKLKSLGFDDNSISAIKVAPGMSVTVFENDLYRGGSLELFDDETCLVNRRADNAISSLIVQPGESAKPFATVLSDADRERLEQGLNCVKPYVEKNLCNAESWNVIRNFCALDKIELMDDGYLEGHVNQGNCTVRNWPVLVQRISDPSQR